MKETIPAHLSLYPLERRGPGVEAARGKCQRLVQTVRKPYRLGPRSLSHLSALSRDHSLASGWEKASRAGGQGGFHFIQLADMSEPDQVLVLRIGVGIKQQNLTYVLRQNQERPLPAVWRQGDEEYFTEVVGLSRSKR